VVCAARALATLRSGWWYNPQFFPGKAAGGEGHRQESRKRFRAGAFGEQIRGSERLAVRNEWKAAGIYQRQGKEARVPAGAQHRRCDTLGIQTALTSVFQPRRARVPVCRNGTPVWQICPLLSQRSPLVFQASPLVRRINLRKTRKTRKAASRQ
jgi:hypothetical protein